MLHTHLEHSLAFLKANEGTNVVEKQPSLRSFGIPGAIRYTGLRVELCTFIARSLVGSVQLATEHSMCVRPQVDAQLTREEDCVSNNSDVQNKSARQSSLQY
jgi:hypothetical protein